MGQKLESSIFRHTDAVQVGMYQRTVVDVPFTRPRVAFMLHFHSVPVPPKEQEGKSIGLSMFRIAPAVKLSGRDAEILRPGSAQPAPTKIESTETLSMRDCRSASCARMPATCVSMFLCSLRVP